MTIIGHFCPSGGRSRLGHEADCPECRAGLLEAFRLPADVPEEDILHRTGIGQAPAGHPHLLLEDTARTVPLGQKIRAALHDTSFVVEMTTPRNGTWRVGCPCGWRKSGSFTNLRMSEAEAICESWAKYHELYPAEPGDDEWSEGE